MRRWAGRIGYAIFIACLLNIGAFFWHTGQVGGSARNGKRKGETYFVGNAGRYTEVSERSWRRVRTHETAFILSFPIAIVLVPSLIALSDSGVRRLDEKNARPDAARS